MLVTKISKTIFPNNKHGWKIADELRKRLLAQNSFFGFEETTESITVIESCSFKIAEEGEQCD